MASKTSQVAQPQSSSQTSRPTSSKSAASSIREVSGSNPSSKTSGSGLRREEPSGKEAEKKNPLRRESSSAKIERLLDTGRGNQQMDEIASEEGLMTVTGERDSSNISRLRNGARQEIDRDTESSADEATNIMRRSSGSHLNYQSTSTTSHPTQQPSQNKRSAKKKPSVQSIRRNGRTESHEEDEAGEHQGWWARVISKYGSVELENKGSVARDHLALERTFLAWLRTSLAFASIGIAITQLFRLNVSSSAPSNASETDRYAALRSMGKPLGATFLGISILMLFIGFNRYFESQHWIIRGKFPASRGSIIIVGLVTFALMVTSLVVVIVVEPAAREK